MKSLFQEQLERVRNGLEKPVGANAHGPEALLETPKELALQQHQDEHRERHHVEDDKDRQQHREQVAHQRSTSPSTISIEPRITTASAT
ncbi:MAG: hypothetical protein KatS3mg061_2724 [Dehalococcoidia bacterium]|nr:MAG: hypothetical protein KatS3mg061_2724 [Dehalococcoidia bacterium]